MAAGTLVAALKADATQTDHLWAATAGTFAVVSSPVESGVRSYEFTQSGTTAFRRLGFVLDDAGRQLVWRSRWDTLPATTQTIFIARTGAADAWRLTLDSGGVLRFANAAGTVIATGTATLAPNTWYRFELAYDIVGANDYRLKLWIDGTLDINHAQTSGGTAVTVAAVHAQWQQASGMPAGSKCYLDSVVVFSSADLTAPGDWRVAAKRPNANGPSGTRFDTTTSTTNSGYGTGSSIYVNERPLASTGARRHNAASGTPVEDFAVEDAATGDVDLTGKVIAGFTGWLHGSGVATDELVLDGTPAVTTSGFENGAMGGATSHMRTKVASAIPTGSVIGLKRATASGTDAILNECGIMVAYADPIYEDLAGVPAGVSSVTAAAERARLLAAAAAGASAVAAAAIRARLLSATVASVSAVAADVEVETPTVEVDLAAAPAGVSAAAGSLERSRGLAATIAAVSTQTAAIARTRPLAATAAAVSGQSAQLGTIHPLSALSAAVSTVAAHVSIPAGTRLLSAASSAVSAVTSALFRLPGVPSVYGPDARLNTFVFNGAQFGARASNPLAGSLTAQVDAVSALSSALVVKRPLAAVTKETSAVTVAELSRSVGLSASIAESSTVDVLFTVKRGAVATVSGVSGVSAAASRMRVLAATPAGVSTNAALLGRTRHLTALSAGISDHAAFLARTRFASSTVAGISAVAAFVARTRPLSALIAAESVALVELTEEEPPVGGEVLLQATIAAVSTTTANGSRSAALAAAPTEISSVQGAIARTRPLSSSVVALSVHSASAARTRPVSATVTAISSHAAFAARTRPLAAAPAESSGVSAALRRVGTLSASAAASSTVAILFTAIRQPTALIEATSELLIGTFERIGALHALIEATSRVVIGRRVSTVELRAELAATVTLQGEKDEAVSLLAEAA